MAVSARPSWEPNGECVRGLMMGGDEDILLYGSGQIMRAVLPVPDREPEKPAVEAKPGWLQLLRASQVSRT